MRIVGALVAAVGVAACVFAVGLWAKAAFGRYESPWYALVVVGLLVAAFGAAFCFVGVRLFRGRSL